MQEFDNIEDKDLKKIAPKLSSIKKEDAFKVPDGYFEEFQANIAELVKEEPKQVQTKPKVSAFEAVFNWLTKPKHTIAFGIVCLVTLASVHFFKANTTDTMNTLTAEENLQNGLMAMNNEDIESFVWENIDDIDEADILSNIDEFESNLYIESDDEMDAYLEELIIEELDEEMLNEWL